MSVASVLASLSVLPLPQAAMRLAEAGVPVIPCVPGEKRPLTRHGFHEASVDLAQVVTWWHRWPSANIGIPTGTVSGVDVVDVDRKPDGNGFDAFSRARRAGLVGGWVAVVRTPSGGAHFYHPADTDRPQPSWQAATARIDFRGTGGYVIVPPSTVTTARGPAVYSLTAGGDREPRPVDATALRDFLDPRPEPVAHRRRAPMHSADARRLADWVGMRAEGERNRGLFWASCRLAEAGLSLPEMVDALAPAGERVGLPPREVVTTISSAYRSTHVQPEASSIGQGDASRRVPRLAGQVLS
ncbi:DNA primase [Microbacterium resistens]|uniref:bifunctional DNA primase/polymerase n=1 Tax=Microbacterium resistens TaxID=156977 RepID=UPI001C5935AA|nr:bifunctional DNA primase/polymerase [Microbacterium resistens]MBW1640029.1 DNA primase [Microbacterium resistens]